MQDIASNLQVSLHKVAYWMEIHKIRRRSRSQANYLKYNPDGEPFSIKKRLTKEDTRLFYLALGLYWGEGGKTVNHSTRLVNSDPALIKNFYRFLIRICQIKPSKVHFHLQTFKDNSIEKAKQYWATQLNINPRQITLSKPIPPQGTGSYRHISKYGVMTLGVYNTHFHSWMMEQLSKLGYNPE